MLDTQLSFNLFDLIVISIVAASVIGAVFRGFIRESLSIATWLGAALITLYAVDDVAQFLFEYVENNFVSTIFATMITYFTTLTMLSILKAFIVKQYIREGKDVGISDNIFGIGLGVVKGWLLVVLGFIVFTFAKGQNAESYPDWVKNASLLPYVERSAMYAEQVLPDYLSIPKTNIGGRDLVEEGVEGATQLGVTSFR